MSTRALIALVGLAAIPWQGCGSEDGPVDVNTTIVELPSKTLALAVSPTSGAVLAETGSGIYVLPRGRQGTARRLEAVLVEGAERVAIGNTLTVAYTDDGLVGSSHPDGTNTRLPADLGLLTSGDDGKSWQSVSLFGEADLHILRPAGATLYAVDFASAGLELKVTNDYGRTWITRQSPGVVTEIAVDPANPKHAFAITDKGLLVTRDQAKSWRPGGTDARALAWAPGGPLYLGYADGSIRASVDTDAAPELRGTLRTGVESLASGRGGALWAIGKDRTVRVSTDGGRRWTVRYQLRERKS